MFEACRGGDAKSEWALIDIVLSELANPPPGPASNDQFNMPTLQSRKAE